MKAIIVEDNPGAVNVLTSFLNEYPAGVTLTGVATTLEAARQLILDEAPDVWLLDIRLHDKVVFSMIRELDPSMVERATIIFLTAYYDPGYIHEALKVSALEYLVKPVDRDKLFEVLDQARARMAKRDLVSRLDHLEERVRHIDARPVSHRIPIYRVNGEIDYEDKRDILYVLTEANVTRIILSGERSIATTKLLKYYEELLEGDQAFLRVSKQVILNLEYLKSFNPRTDIALLSNGASIQVSRRKAAQLVELLSGRK